VHSLLLHISIGQPDSISNNKHQVLEHHNDAISIVLLASFLLLARTQRTCLNPLQGVRHIISQTPANAARELWRLLPPQKQRHHPFRRYIGRPDLSRVVSLLLAGNSLSAQNDDSLSGRTVAISNVRVG
jgi:hypothetical protein